nr:type II toxin-antitoxin system antitoxin SocA domain-containing protein [uncultured Schaedlerella sp.]
MAQTLAVAKFFNELHVEKHGCAMDQMKMHKMMYFSQRESLMISSNPLFNDDFEAWKYGPVLVNVRGEYLTGHMFTGTYDKLDDAEKELVVSVFERYDKYGAWQLSTLSHAEHSWLQARKGLVAGEAGNKKMSLNAMRADAKREFLRRKGVVLA